MVHLNFFKMELDCNTLSPLSEVIGNESCMHPAQKQLATSQLEHLLGKLQEWSQERKNHTIHKNDYNQSYENENAHEE